MAGFLLDSCDVESSSTCSCVYNVFWTTFLFRGLTSTKYFYIFPFHDKSLKRYFTSQLSHIVDLCPTKNEKNEVHGGYSCILDARLRLVLTLSLATCISHTRANKSYWMTHIWDFVNFKLTNLRGECKMNIPCKSCIGAGNYPREMTWKWSHLSVTSQHQKHESV